MDRLSGLDARRVMQALSSNLEKERRSWKPIVMENNEVIGEVQRDEAVSWITGLAAEFKFLPETCGLAIHLLDRVLQLVKVRAKYLQCVAVTCLYIAAKTHEEDENIPSTPDLVRKSHCGCSFSEITRMEIVILSKLNWEVRFPTAVDFLHTIQVVLVLHYPHLLQSSGQLAGLMRQLLRCLSSHKLLVYRPSTLALTLLSLHLEQITPGWLRLILALQRMTNVGSEQLMQCRETMAEILGHQLLPGYTASRERLSSSSAPRTKKRKVEHCASSSQGASNNVDCHEMEDENMYDGIRRLYGEDSLAGEQQQRGALRASCSLEMHQDTCDENKPTALLVN